jgi:hypothetical protein
MNLRVIEGGLAPLHAVTIQMPTPRRIDVESEAERRLLSLGYDRWRSRQMATSVPMPREIHYRALQIQFVAKTLGELAAIPPDFRSDIYWPA